MILIPLLIMLLGGGMKRMQTDVSGNAAVATTFALAKNSRTEDIKTLVCNEILKNYPNISLIDSDEPLEALKSEKVRLVLEFEEDYAEKLKVKKPFSIKVMYDKSKAKSEGSVGVIMTAINDFNWRIVEERLEAIGQSSEMLEPVRVEQENVAEKKDVGNPVLAMLLPMMVSILMVSGGIPAATDLVAGEKERNTFEPLLTTKPDRVSILAGKYMTVVLFSFITLAAIAAGFAAGYLINPKALFLGFNEWEAGFNIPPLAIVLLAGVCMALSMTFAGIEITLSTYAKSFKEAQTYLSFLVFAVMIPAYATMFMQPDDISMYMFAIPVLNMICAFKMALGGIIDYMAFGIAAASSVLYVAAALVFAASLFGKEKVLFRS